MTIEELKTKVNHVCSQEAWANVYLLMKTDDESRLQILKANMVPDALEGVIALYRRFLQTEILEKIDLNIISLSSADERTNVIYKYDINEVPNELEVALNTDLSNVNAFSFDIHSLLNLLGFIIKIGTDDNNMLLFKKHYPINLIQGKSGMFCKKHNQLEEFDGEILRINGSVDFIKADEDILIISLNELEKFCKFHEIIKKEAELGIQTIIGLALLESVEPLQDEIDSVSFSRKLTKVINNSAVINQEMPKIIDFARRKYPNIKFSDDGTKIRLDTKKSKNEFLKLLNDDLLKSELTDLEYDSVAKDAIV